MYMMHLYLKGSLQQIESPLVIVHINEWSRIDEKQDKCLKPVMETFKSFHLYVSFVDLKLSLLFTW